MARRIRRDFAILWPGIGAQLVASTGNFVLPLVISVLMTQVGLDEQTAGLLVSLELTASALTTIAMSAYTRPHSRRAFAMFGAALAIAGHAAALISPALPLLAATRLVAGIGAGIVAAEAAAIIARGRDRERLISGLTIAAIVNGSLWLFAMPYVIGDFGYRGPYMCLLLTCVLGAILLSRLPSPPMRKRGTTQTATERNSLLGALVLPAILLTQLGQGSFWTFVGVYGSTAGLSDEVIGGFLSAATLMLLIGVIGTAIAGVRLGRFGPLFILTGINAAAILAISYAPDANTYYVANTVQAITNLASVVYQLGLAAAIDRSGRLVAAASGLVNLGNGLGPSAAGFIAGAFGAPAVGVFVVGFNAVAMALFALIGVGIARGAIRLRS